MSIRQAAVTLCAIVVVSGATTSCGEPVGGSAGDAYGRLGSAFASAREQGKNLIKLRAACDKMVADGFYSSRKIRRCLYDQQIAAMRSKRSLASKLDGLSSELPRPCGPAVKKWSDAMKADLVVQEEYSKHLMSPNPSFAGAQAIERRYRPLENDSIKQLQASRKVCSS